MTSKLLRQKSTAFLKSPVALISLYAVLGLIGVLLHDMWRDEFNTWLILRDSTSLGEVLSRVKYQGHTALWALSLYALKAIVDHPVIMQLFNWAVAVLAIVLFWRYSPFKHWQKALFTFGYIPFYEYILVARPYALGMASLFGFCALFPTRRRTYLWLAMMLGLMANSNAYALFIATALVFTLAVEFCLDATHRATYWRQTKTYDLILSILILAGSFAFALYILATPADSYNHGGLEAWGRIFGGYTLIIPHGEKWPDLIGCGLLTLFAVMVFVLGLIRKPFALLFFSAAYGIMLAFTYFRFMGIGPRHYAHFYLVVIAASWLASDYAASDRLVNLFSLPPNLVKTAQRLFMPVLMTIVGWQFLAGLIYAYPRDLIIPLSAAHETAQYIQQQGWQDEFIVASRDANMAAVSGYLDRKLYYPELRRMGSFTLYREGRVPVTHDQVLAQTQAILQTAQGTLAPIPVPASALAASAGIASDTLSTQPSDPVLIVPGTELPVSQVPADLERVLLVLHVPLEATSEALAITPIQSFERAWEYTERYFLYWAALAASPS